MGIMCLTPKCTWCNTLAVLSTTSALHIHPSIHPSQERMCSERGYRIRIRGPDALSTPSCAQGMPWIYTVNAPGGLNATERISKTYLKTNAILCGRYRPCSIHGLIFHFESASLSCLAVAHRTLRRHRNAFPQVVLRRAQRLGFKQPITTLVKVHGDRTLPLWASVDHGSYLAGLTLSADPMYRS